MTDGYDKDENGSYGRVITMTCARAFRTVQHEIGAFPEDCYLITISAKLKEDAIKRGWNYETSLAPSSTLFGLMQDKKKELNYDRSEVFNTFYRPRFIEEISNSTVSNNMLIELHKKLKRGRNILLVCFCGDADTCHRGIIKEILELSLFEVRQ